MKLRSGLFTLLFLTLVASARAQHKPAAHAAPGKPTAPPVINSLELILKKHPEYFGSILKYPGRNQVQIIYTQIDRDKNNVPSFKTYTYRANRAVFFYPASLVKLPAAALALEKMNELSKFGITPNTTMLTDSAYTCQYSTLTDAGSENGYPSLASYIRRMLLISDNEAYSRVFEFLTPEYIHRKLTARQYPYARIRIRFDAPCLGAPNNWSNPIRFVDENGKILYRQAPKYFAASQLPAPVMNTVKFIDFSDESNPNLIIKKDFSRSNFLCLSDAHQMLKDIMFPDQALPVKRFHLKPADYRFLWKYLQMLPYESDYPTYPDRTTYFDSYKKYLFYGQDSTIITNTGIRIFNIVGESYGYTTDCAYIVDFTNKVEFILSATYFIQNTKGIIDGRETTLRTEIMPFFKHLGQSIYEYELSRNRKNLPDLSAYKF